MVVDGKSIMNPRIYIVHDDNDNNGKHKHEKIIGHCSLGGKIRKIRITYRNSSGAYALRLYTCCTTVEQNGCYNASHAFEINS